MNLNFIWVMTLWYPTLEDGVVNKCGVSDRSLLHAGSGLGVRGAFPVDAQVGPGRKERGICPGGCQSYVAGLTQSPGHWKQGSCAARSGRRLPRCMTMRQYRYRRLRRLVSISAACGRHRLSTEHHRANQQLSLSPHRSQRSNKFQFQMHNSCLWPVQRS